MRNLSVNQQDYEGRIEYPIKQAPEWGTEMRGPVDSLYNNPALSREWIVDPERPSRDLYVAFPAELSGEDLKALDKLQALNNYSDKIRTRAHSYVDLSGDSGLPHDGNWITVTSDKGRLRVEIKFIARWKKDI